MILLAIVLTGTPQCVANWRQFSGSLFVICENDGIVGNYAIDCGDNPKI
jgi:hypothetical protein